MELKQIKELMAAMGRSGTKKLIIKKGTFELHLERDGQNAFLGSENVTDESLQRQDMFNRRVDQPLPSTSNLPSAIKQEAAEAVGTFVTSPMVGTFYSAPSPEDPSFIKVGDHITKDTIVCIIEAMKVMNEIKAQVSGVVTEILVESGSPVEFGTKLFRVQ